MKHFYTLSIAMLLGLTASATLPDPDAGYSDWTLLGTGTADLTNNSVQNWPDAQKIYSISAYTSENPQTGSINYFLDGFMPNGVMIECSDKNPASGKVWGSVREADTGLTYDGNPVYISDPWAGYDSQIQYYRPLTGEFGLSTYLYTGDPQNPDRKWYLSTLDSGEIQLEGEDFKNPRINIVIAGIERETGRLKLNVTMQDVSGLTAWAYPWPEEKSDADFIFINNQDLPEGGVEATADESGPLYFDLPSDGPYLIAYDWDEGDYHDRTYFYNSNLIYNYIGWRDWGTTDILDPLEGITYISYTDTNIPGLKVQRYGSENIYRILNPYDDNSHPVTWGLLTIDDPEVDTEIIIDARDPEHCEILTSNLGVSSSHYGSYDIVSINYYKPYSTSKDNSGMDLYDLWGKQENNVITFPAGHFNVVSGYKCPNVSYTLFSYQKDWSVSVAPDDFEFYLRGEVNGWGSGSEYRFLKQDDGTYTLTVPELYGEFKIADADWSSVNFGANVGGAEVGTGAAYAMAHNSNTNMTLADALTDVTLTVDFARMTLTVTGTTDGIESIAADGDNTPAVYYDLNGRCIGSDADVLPAGVYIRVQGRTVTKEIVR